MNCTATVTVARVSPHISYAPVARPDMLTSTALGRTVPHWRGALGSGAAISSRRECFGNSINRLTGRVTDCIRQPQGKQLMIVRSRQQDSMYRQLPPPPFKNGSRSGAGESPTYGRFLDTSQGGFTRDGKFREWSSASPPVRAASSGALPISPEGDENVIRPIDAFEGLLGVAGAAPRDADAQKGDAEVSGDVSKEEVRRRGRAVAGIDQGRLVEAWEIADADSRFAEYRKVYIHYKIAMPGGEQWSPLSGTERDAEGKLMRKIDRLGGSNSSAKDPPESISEARDSNEVGEASTSGRPAFPSILLHGFGASLFSWERILQPVADLAGGPALAFDRPTFGLSARVEPRNLPVNPYSEKFSAAATLAFVNFLGAKKAVLLA